MESKKLIRPVNLSQQVVDDLGGRILEENLQPGYPLPSERELCEQYQVSRTVIREAVKILAAKGLVDAKPGSGLVVAKTKISDVSDVIALFLRNETDLKYHQLHELRIVLEIEASRLAAKRRSQTASNRLIELAHDLVNLSRDIEAASKNDFDFHHLIFSMTGNDFFELVYQSLESALMETRVATFSAEIERVPLVSSAHLKIAEAIAEGDSDLAAKAMREHLEEVESTWKKYLDTEA